MVGNIIIADDLNVNSEKDVFEAIKHWFYKDKKTKRKDFCNLLQHIRYTRLPAKVNFEFFKVYCINISELKLIF